MKRRPLLLGIVVLLAAGGLWLARSARRSDDSAFQKPSAAVGTETPSASSQSGQMPDQPPRFAPPDPNRKFEKLTPEERVQLARRGPIGG